MSYQTNKKILILVLRISLLFGTIPSQFPPTIYRILNFYRFHSLSSVKRNIKKFMRHFLVSCFRFFCVCQGNNQNRFPSKASTQLNDDNKFPYKNEQNEKFKLYSEKHTHTNKRF